LICREFKRRIIQELKTEDYLLEIGSQRFVPGFEEQLIGMKNGEIKEVKVNFLLTIMKINCGKEIIFNVTLKGIKEKKLPETDDNFIKILTGTILWKI